MIFEKDKTYYTYSKNLGLIEFVYIDTAYNKVNFRDKHNSIVSIDSSRITQLKESKDEAYLDAFIKDRDNYVSEIEKHEKSIKKIKNKLDKLDKQFGYLKKIYPEEFV